MTYATRFDWCRKFPCVLLLCSIAFSVHTSKAAMGQKKEKEEKAAAPAPKPAAAPAVKPATPATRAVVPGTKPVDYAAHPPIGPNPSGPVTISRGTTRIDHPLPDGGTRTTTTMPGGKVMTETLRPAPGGGGMVRTASYGPGHVVVERPIYGRPGFVRRSTLIGGRPYAVVYRNYYYNRWPYYRPVPAYIYAPGFYAWGLQPWGALVVYGWGWYAQPWYGVYGGAFTPYPSYASLDLWMTDYVIAANLQRSYEAGQANANTVTPPPQSVPPPGGASAFAPPGAASASAPPPITPEMKDQIAAQIKLEMQEQQQEAAGGPAAVVPPPDPAGAAPPEEMPDALKPGHTLFRVVAPLSVKAGGTPCNLTPDDYITRTSDLNGDGMVTVKVKASRSTDCPQGATSTVALNDLMAMESDQQERVMDGLQVAAQNMGRNGLPAGPPPRATPVPAGQTVADPNLADTLTQQQSDAANDAKTVSGQGGAGS
jgi:hypothetical protein